MARQSACLADLSLLVQPGKLRDAKTADGKPRQLWIISSIIFSRLMVPLALMSEPTLALGGMWSFITRRQQRRRLSQMPQRKSNRPRIGTSAGQSASAWQLGPISRKNWLESEEQATGTRLRRRPQSNRANRRVRSMRRRKKWAVLQSRRPRAAAGKVPAQFLLGFGLSLVLSTLLLAYYYRRMDGEQFEILKELAISVVPLGVLTIVVLAVILLGICTATESAAIGALGALYLAVHGEISRAVAVGGVFVGGVIGVALGIPARRYRHAVVSVRLGATFVGTGIPLMHRTCRNHPSCGAIFRKRLFLPPRPRRWCVGCSSARRCFPACSLCTAAKA